MKSVLLIGLGRFGSAVAVTQDQLGYEIPAVEKNPARVQAFAGRFPLVEADATSKDALEQLGAREFRSGCCRCGVVFGGGGVDHGEPGRHGYFVDLGEGDVLAAWSYPAPRGSASCCLPRFGCG